VIERGLEDRRGAAGGEQGFGGIDGSALPTCERNARGARASVVASRGFADDAARLDEVIGIVAELLELGVLLLEPEPPRALAECEQFGLGESRRVSHGAAL
jgi:hypothetical protein